jgi:pyroglutamyl-peptidase
MKALVTGFEPFNGDVINPSEMLLGRVNRQLGSLSVETCVLPTEFGRSLTVLDGAIDRVRPDIVLSVGLAGGRTALSIERVAINIDDARIPDNAGAQPIDVKVIPDGPPAYFSNLPVKAILQALRQAGLPAELSNSAGTFVCNHLFYGLMHRSEAAGIRGGFLHVPYLPQQAARHGGAASMALEHMVQAVEIVLAVTAQRGRDVVRSEGALD